MTETFAASLPRLIALAARWLRWPPDTFWNATPQELASALADPEQALQRPLTRHEFEHLMESEGHGRHH